MGVIRGSSRIPGSGPGPWTGAAREQRHPTLGPPMPAAVRRAQTLLTVLAALLVLLAGCDRTETPAVTTRPVEVVAATQPAVPVAPRQPVLVDGSADWSRDEALGQLREGEDERTRLTAAVRLAQHQGGLPEELPDAFVADLAVQSLGDLGWVLGSAADPHANADGTIRVLPLQMPLLLDAAGQLRAVEYYADLAICYPSRDAEVFPHLVVTPFEVWCLDQEGLRPALVAADLRGGWFQWRFNNGYPYVIVRHPAAEEGELARYRWDPYELTFMGPLMERVPGEDDGLMALNLDASRLLIPVGGHVPVVEAAEREPEPNDQPPELELPPF